MKQLLFIILIGFILASCSTLNKSRMLRTPRNYEFQEFADSVKNEPYKIAIDDEIQIQLYSNDGYNFVQLSGTGSGSGGQGNNRANAYQTYKVRLDSTIKVPVIGKIKVVGLSLEDLELKIENFLKKSFNQPFALIAVRNRRVFLFKGGSSGSVIKLENEKTTLFEILASSGGLDSESNASRIKVIRGNAEKPEIFLIDLSTVEGMKKANVNMKAGDIVYIDPYFNYAQRLSADISSIMGLISSVLLIYTVTQN